VNGDWAYLATCRAAGAAGSILPNVSWQIDDNMEEDLIISAYQKAIDWRKHLAGLIVHSDRGGQYVAAPFKAVGATPLLTQYEPGG